MAFAATSASFTCPTLPLFYENLTGMKSRVKKAAKGAMSEIGEDVLAETRAELYPGHGYRTGTLWLSYKYKVNQAGDETHLKFWTDCEYAPYVEFRWGGRISHFRPAVEQATRDGQLTIDEWFNEVAFI